MKPTKKIIKKSFAFASLFLMSLSSTAFANNEGIPASKDEEFIFIIAYPGNQNDSKSMYISGMIQYDGYDACSKDYYTSHDLFSEAGQKFLNYLESEYSLDKKDWKLQYVGNLSGNADYADYPSGYFTGFGTKAETQNIKESYIRNKKNDGVHKIYDTDFTYKCHVAYSSSTAKTQPQQNNTVGKAYWFSYYIKNDNTVYVTKVYNNDCNHCGNEISEAFVKWLILNDYDNRATTLHVNNMNDVKESALDERRTEKILWYKQKGYAVVNVGFTYIAK